mmetsp:Transcript_1709/g.6670  ORF Transcript_1709/g.6670 Transcript_1709/m.6670 type:complete len:516 (-) Transcript_1709:113-1660(-)
MAAVACGAEGAAAGTTLPRIGVAVEDPWAPLPPASAPLTPKRRPGHPSPAASAKAWPQFVPRMELDVILRSVDEKLQELGRRIGRQEGNHADVQQRFEAWCTRIDGDFATKNSVHTLSSKLNIEVTGCRRDLEEGLDEVRSFAASEDDFRKACDAHTQRFRVLDEEVAGASRERAVLREQLRAAEDSCKETYATKLELGDACLGLKQSCLDLQQQLSQTQQDLDSHDVLHQRAQDTHEQLRQRHDDHELKTSVTSHCLDCIGDNVAELTRFCHERLATNVHLEQLETRLAETSKVADQSSVGVKTLSEELEHERSLIRRTVHDHSGSFKEMHRLMTDLFHVNKVKGDLSQRCDGLDEGLGALDGRERKHWDAWTEALEGLRKQHSEVQRLQHELRREVLQHVAQLEAHNEDTRQYSTSIFFLKQLDEAMHVAKPQGSTVPAESPAALAESTWAASTSAAVVAAVTAESPWPPAESPAAPAEVSLESAAEASFESFEAYTTGTEEDISLEVEGRSA